MLDVGFLSHLGHCSRYIDFKFMRWRILTGMKAGAAVMAKISEIVQISR
jgi:hypothetical protein